MSQYNNDYYGSGGGGGGGFLAGGSPFGSGNGSPGGLGRRTEASHSLRPLTCKQMLTATQAHTDADWQVDGNDIGQVTLVGHVMSINRQATNVMFWIEDGTGRIEARQWIDSSADGDDDKLSGIEEGSYVRATGGIKNFGNKRYLNANNIRPSANPAAEPYFHILEVMFVNRILEKGPPPGPGQTQVKNGHTGPSAYTDRPLAGAATDQYAHLPPIQRQILNAITTQMRGDEGVHVAAIARTVGGDANTISDALDKLLEEGLVFTTVDDSHFNTAQ